MILYLQCASGISGDMLVGALLALVARRGAVDPVSTIVRPAIAAAGVDPALVSAHDVRRGGIAASAFTVADAPGFATFAELERAVGAADLEPRVKDDVAALARMMASAETLVHGQDSQHLHELSGVDTVVDLLAAATLIAHLSPCRIVASPPVLGGGRVTTSHGTVPVPAPAVLALLDGCPTAGAGDASEELGELTTPTGAALLRHYADEYAEMPGGLIEGVGYGAGSREVPGRPNVLRATLIAESGPGRGQQGSRDDHVLLETNIDDMSPELLGHAAEALRGAGALDVWLTGATMKKGRAGHVLSVLARSEDGQRLADLVFAETSSFGVRVLEVGRLYADERREKIVVEGHEIGVRLGHVAGRLVTVSPEYEDVLRLALATDRPVKDAYGLAQATARGRWADPGESPPSAANEIDSASYSRLESAVSAGTPSRPCPLGRRNDEGYQRRTR